MTTGSCLCGAVRWRMESPYIRMTNCHCSMCRKAHGAPFATYIRVDKNRFELLSGAESITIYEASASFKRRFCSQCGSVTWIGGGDFIGVAAGCLNEDPGIRSQQHIFTASKAPWHVIADTLPQADEFTPGTNRPVINRPGPATTEPGVLHGSCLCGGVAFTAALPILAVYNCHCSRCRKARAAAHTTNGFVDPKGLHFLHGEDLLEQYKIPEAKFFTQAFCRVCGSGMPHRDMSRPRVGIPFGSLDTDPGQGASHHIYCASKAPWFTITDDISQHAEGP